MTHSAPITSAPANMTPLPNGLRPHLTPTARAWLDQALAEAAQGITPTTELHLAEAARRCGPPHADTARILILQAAHPTPSDLTRVYDRGTADERRAVLQALPHVIPGPEGLPLVEDALRTNDTRLLTAALGPYAARHLSAHLWRHAILKCLFTGVPVAGVAQLAARAHGDAELARMLADFAAERIAAGRPVPDDLHHVLALTDPEAAPPLPAPEGGGPHGKES